MRAKGQCCFPFSVSRPSVEMVSGLLTSHLGGPHRLCSICCAELKDGLKSTQKHGKRPNGAVRGIECYTFMGLRNFENLIHPKH